MGDSKYPGELDTDVELPRVDDNITEIGGEAINGTRSSIFNIEEALGTDPQGTATDVAARLGVSLNPDGSLKASALSAVGLVTLPIDNAQVGTNAGIEESKLDLDYSTVVLRQLIASLDAFVLSINNRLIIDINNLSQHVTHPGVFGRHRTSDIDGYTGKYASYDAQGMIDDLDTRLINHVTDTIDAHDASAISFVDTGLNIVADDVQEAIEQVDELQSTLMVRHRDNQHSNGILSTQETLQIDSNRSRMVVDPAAINTAPGGINAVQFTSGPPGLAGVSRWSVIDIYSGTDVFSFLVSEVNTSTNTVTFVGTLPITVTAGTAAIFESGEEIGEPSVLALTIRQDNMIQLVHPGAPYALSSGIDPRELDAYNANIKIRWLEGETLFYTDDLDVFTAMSSAYTLESTWTAENMVPVLNDMFRSHSPERHHPLIAFAYKGELGIALDTATGNISTIAPSANSAWEVLGFHEVVEPTEAAGPRKFYIDGYEFSGIRKIVDATGEVEAGTPQAIENLTADLVTIGLSNSDGGLVRVRNTASDNGTYVFGSIVAPDTLPFSALEHSFSTPDTSVRVEIYADYFYSNPSTRTLYELFVDGYEFESAQLRGAKRIEYVDASGSPALENRIDVVAIARTLQRPEAALRLAYDDTANTFQLGGQGGGLAVTNGGPVVDVPTTNEEGFRVKVYNVNGIDYIEVVVVDGGFIGGGDAAIDFTIHNRLTEEKFVQLATALHDTSTFKHLTDTRGFGTVSRRDVGDDYTRDYISYPRSLLRGGGVIYGMDTSDSSGDIRVAGGQVLANGSIFSIEARLFKVPSEALTYNVYVDGDGVLRTEADDQFVGANDFATPSLGEIVSSTDKTILAQVDVNGAGSITDIRDLRRFVNNIDNKIDLIAEENDVTHGSFASLEAAFEYINASVGPAPRRIRIRGEVSYDLADGALTTPAGITIMGDARTDDTSVARPKILLSGSGSAFLLPSDGLTIKDLEIQMAASAAVSAVLGSSSANVANLTLQNCLFDNISNSSGFARVVDSDNLTDAVIDSCVFNFDPAIGAVGALAIDAASGMDTVQITNCSATLTSTGQNYFMLAAATNIANLFMSNCVITFPASSTNAIGVYVVAGELQTTWIDNCYFDLGNTSVSGRGISAPTTENVFVSNCHMAYTSISASNVGVLANDMSQTQVKGCYFTNVNSGVWGAVQGEGVKISDCYFLIGNNAIDFTDTIDLMINNNTIAKLSGVPSSSTNFIDITDSQRVLILGNILRTTVTNAPDGVMILITRTSTDVTHLHIKDNVLQNTGTTNQGIEVGIFLDSSTADGIKFASVSGNVVSGFFGASASQAILADGVADSIINGNVVVSARLALKMIDCDRNVITNNNLEGVDNSRVVYITWSGVAGGRSVFSNNRVANANAVSITQDLVYIENTGTTLLDYIVNGNTFEIFDLASIGGSLLAIEGASHVVTNNIFYGETFTTNEPLVAGSNGLTNTFVAHNSFKMVNSIPGTTMIDFGGGTGNVDFMNHGQIYSVIVPMGNAIISRDELGATSWVVGATGQWQFDTDNTIFTAANDEVIWFCGTDFVPSGATVVTVKISYNIGGGGTVASLQMGLSLLSGFAPASSVTRRTLQNVASATGGTDTETMTPSSTIIMQYEDVLAATILVVTGGTYNITVYEMQVNYIL
jgi:hypothetical protein